MKPTLTEIDEQIAELYQQRDKTVAEEEKEKIEEFCKFEWTHDRDASIRINWFLNENTPRYELMVSGSPYFHTKSFCAFGDGRPSYIDNIMYGNHPDYFQIPQYNTRSPYFYTSSVERLLEFLKQVKFKRIHYDETTLIVLLAARKANEDRIIDELQFNRCG